MELPFDINSFVPFYDPLNITIEYDNTNLHFVIRNPPGTTISELKKDICIYFKEKENIDVDPVKISLRDR